MMSVDWLSGPGVTACAAGASTATNAPAATSIDNRFSINPPWIASLSPPTHARARFALERQAAHRASGIAAPLNAPNEKRFHGEIAASHANIVGVRSASVQLWEMCVLRR